MALTKINYSGQGAIPSANLPTGSVLQVVQAVKTDKFTNSSSTADIPGLSVNITPSSSNSKMYIMVNICGMANNTGCSVRLNGTTNGDICLANADGSRSRASVGDFYRANNFQFSTQGFNFLDLPNTTNQQTYKIIAISVSGNTLKVNRGNVDSDNSSYLNGTSSITVMEIAG